MAATRSPTSSRSRWTGPPSTAPASTLRRSPRAGFPCASPPVSREFVVEATMPFRNDGEGLHRSVDPADGRAYVYGMSFMDAAPTVFACFDQPDLKAPYTMHVTASADWLVSRQRPCGGGRQRGRSPGVAARPHSPALDLLRHPRRRSLPPARRRARRHPALAKTRGRASRRRWTAKRPGALRPHRAKLRRAAPAVRHPLRVRRLPPGVRPGVQRRARWRTPAASPSGTRCSSTGPAAGRSVWPTARL